MKSDTTPLAFIVDPFGPAINYSIPDSERGFAQYLNVDHATMLDIFRQCDRKQFAAGEIGSETFLTKLNKELVHRKLPKLSLPELTLLWTSTYSRNEEVLTLLSQLSKVAPTYYRATGNDIDLSWARIHGIVGANFLSGSTFSCELPNLSPPVNVFIEIRERVAKPLHRQAWNIDWPELCYIGSTEQGTEEARELGLQVIAYTGPADIQAAIARFRD
jgi:hypothetical protein